MYPTLMNILVLQTRLNKPKCICCYFHQRDRSFHFFIFCLILLSDDFCCHFIIDFIHNSYLCSFRYYLLGISVFRICMPFFGIFSCSIVCYKYASYTFFICITRVLSFQAAQNKLMKQTQMKLKSKTKLDIRMQLLYD